MKININDIKFWMDAIPTAKTEIPYLKVSHDNYKQRNVSETFRGSRL